MTTLQFAPAPKVATFVIPAGVTSMQVDVAAGSGVPVTSYEVGAGTPLAGGRAARVRGVVAVVPGDVWWVAVGAQGLGAGRATNPSGIGDAGVAGGAATVLGKGEVSLANAVVIAGGGGGGGEDGTGGDGGGVGQRSSGTGGGGQGGGQDPTWTDPDGETTTTDGCGGGGGGALGGRAGSVLDGKRGGGGGGSSRRPAGTTIASDWTGPGAVTLVYGAAPLAPTNLRPAQGDKVAAGRPFASTWDFVGAIEGDRQGSASVQLVSAGGTFSRQVTGEGEEVLWPPEAAVTGSATLTVATTQTSGAAGPSSSTTFAIATPVAAPVITSPGPNTTPAGPTLPLQWTAIEQQAFRVLRTDPTGTTVYDDTTTPSATVREVDVTVVAGRAERIVLTVFGSNGVESDPDTVRVSPRFTRPATPDVVVVADAGDETTAPSLRLQVTHPTEPGRPPAVRSTYEVQAIAPEHLAQLEPRHPIDTDTDGAGVTRWRLPSSGVTYQVLVTDYDALGVPATGTSDIGTGGWGVSPWGVGPWGS